DGRRPRDRRPRTAPGSHGPPPSAGPYRVPPPSRPCEPRSCGSREKSQEEGRNGEESPEEDSPTARWVRLRPPDGVSAGEYEVGEREITRRGALGLAGKGAVAVWTVPTIMSVPSVAAAQGSVEPVLPGDFVAVGSSAIWRGVS